MKIVLTKEDSEEIFFNSLCNGLGEMCNDYNLSFVYDSDEYQKAKDTLRALDPDRNKTTCFEDVLMQMLRVGGKLSIVDPDSEEAYSVEIADVHKRVKTTPIQHLIDIIKQNDDYYTANAVLQTVFMKGIIYG